MEIFHSYVSLPEGMPHVLQSYDAFIDTLHGEFLVFLTAVDAMTTQLLSMFLPLPAQ
jgi:hypothetical protein